jgi:hypothetical protein
VHGDSCKVFAHEFAFPGVYATTHVQTECTHCLADRASASDADVLCTKSSQRKIGLMRLALETKSAMH